MTLQTRTCSVRENQGDGSKGRYPVATVDLQGSSVRGMHVRQSHQKTVAHQGTGQQYIYATSHVTRRRGGYRPNDIIIYARTDRANERIHYP
jgi:hypothetical protein